jgi:hypothetical protein
MSSVPFAKWSTVSGITVMPEKWESYPTIERSSVQSCVFQNLGSSTTILRSRLHAVTLQSQSGTSNKHSYIKRSHVSDSVVADSSLKHCKVSHSVMNAVGHAKWTRAQGSHVDRVAYLKRAAVDDSTMRNVKYVKSASVKRSSVGDCAKIKRSTLLGVRVTNSVVESSALTDCEVADAEIYRTSFSGMILKNGIWKNGQLIGRTNDKEAVVRPLEGIEKKVPLRRLDTLESQVRVRMYLVRLP